MDKPYSNSIQSMTLQEIALVFSILSERELSKPMRDALVLRYDSGFGLTNVASRSKVDRGALSAAENKVLDTWRKIHNHFEKAGK